MELQFTLIFTSILFLFMLLQLTRSKLQNRNSKLPPQPWKLPIIGHLHHLLGHLPHRTLSYLAIKHGPLIFLRLGEIPMVVASSPRVAKEILKTNDIVFSDRGALLAGKILTYDNAGILFSPYNERWRQLRKICTLELLSAKKVQSFFAIREEEVANLVENIFAMSGSPVDLTQKISLLGNDITSRAAFGKKCKEKEMFLSLMREVGRYGSGFAIADLFPSFKLFHGISGVKAKLEKIQYKINKILDDILNEHRLNRMKNNSTNNCKMEEDLVDVLLRVQEDNLEFHIDDNSIKAVILEIFIAGSESPSATVEWAMSELMKNPRVMEKTQSEVRKVFQGKQKVCQSDINELNYLRCVIKETLRLHPPTPLLVPRESRERCEINGYEIAKGTKVIVNAWAIGRDPEYWSEAEIFKPERFEDLSVNYMGTNFEYIPFGAGKRICPGITYGIANLEIQLAQLLYHFDWKLTKGKELDMTERSAGTVGRNSNLRLIPTPYIVLN
ncbi:hypothetical protein AQUCO_01200180v1 [Aquilegia coerulea]|uniref:Cytochrome P450 n=1 Tax=Aquilegia coerulea TaxID=218851 RepID=A0A2G5E4X1_AQUCA|nr:hypothetical protein AQUCO_01200180v1 [Aquilegia coerulea]